MTDPDLLEERASYSLKQHSEGGAETAQGCRTPAALGEDLSEFGSQYPH